MPRKKDDQTELYPLLFLSKEYVQNYYFGFYHRKRTALICKSHTTASVPWKWKATFGGRDKAASEQPNAER